MIALASITRFQPRRESIYADEAEARTRLFAERWKIRPRYFDSCNAMSRFLYPEAVSVERLQAACTVHSILWFIADLFSDTNHPNPPGFETVPEFGLDLRMISAFLSDLMCAFRTHQLSPRPTPIEEAFCEAGRLVARESTPEWFQLFTDGIEAHLTAVMSRKRDPHGRQAPSDLRSCIDVCEHDPGGLHTCQLVELTRGAFLPPEVRAHNDIRRLSWLATRMVSCVGDIFSYHEDVVLNDNNLNLVRRMMDLEGLSFEEAVVEAVRLVNTYAQEFVDLRVRLPGWGGEVGASVCGYVDGLADLMSGSVYWHATTNRCRSPESPFSELRQNV